MIDLSGKILLKKPDGQPVYLQIAAQVIKMIEEKTLPDGVQLPSSRQLSLNLDVHRNTVSAAYEELLQQGWLRSVPRKGYFVCQAMSAPAAAMQPASTYPEHTSYPIFYENNRQLQPSYPTGIHKYAFNEGFPDVTLTPLKELLAEYRTIARRGVSKKLLSYSAKEGSAHLREQLVKMLRQTRGLHITVENVFVSKGAQMGMYLAASLLLRAGDYVIVADPGFFVVTQMFLRMGMQVLRVKVDDDGMDIDAVEMLCQNYPVRMVYVIPHHHHPTTVTLSESRRTRLLNLAAKHRFAILEDDFDFDIYYENAPILPMASIDREGSVIYVGTLTKVLAPSIRIGFVVGPKNLISLLGQHRYTIDLQGDNLLEEAAAELFKSGNIERHLKKIRSLYRQRRDLICGMLKEHLPFANFRIPTGGMCVWVTFAGVDTRLIAETASGLGLFIRDGKNHNPEGSDLNSMCIGFAAMGLQDLQQATSLLIEAAKQAYALQNGTSQSK